MLSSPPTVDAPCSGESARNVSDSAEMTGRPVSPEFSLPGPDHVTLACIKKKWTYQQDFRLENNLYGIVGFMELANAGDFAANVWNDTPVPVYAVVFMAIGGTVAGVLSIFAFFDAHRAWQNIKFLRRERRHLRDQRSERDEPQINVLLELTTRELRIEVINRWAMGILMGASAVMVSLGTFLAIGGANRRVWLASNILSGYLGNAPMALFGLMSSIWAIHMWRIMHHHKVVGMETLQDQTGLKLLRERCFNVQLFYLVNGVAAILGAVGSMMTATMWYGYVILIPVIISALFGNIWWRKRVGYDRPHIDCPSEMTIDGLSRAIHSATDCQRIIKEQPGNSLTQLVANPNSIIDVLSFLVKHGMFEGFCLRLIDDEQVQSALDYQPNTALDMSTEVLLTLKESLGPQILHTAQEFIDKRGFLHFTYRQRFLVEVLGVYLSSSQKETGQEINEKK